MLARGGGSSAPSELLFTRRHDRGASWRFLLNANDDPSVGVAGLAYDPSAPDYLYLAPTGAGEAVQASPEGGETWQQLGADDKGRVTSLALGIDGRNLYAGTDRGP